MANTRATTLPPYDVLLPEVGADDDTWGNALNGNWNIFSTELQRVEVNVDAAQSAADAAQTDADAAKAAADAAQATANTADGKADANTADKVAKAGDTMTGNLTVPDGTDPGHAVNKSQLDALPTADENHDVTGVASYIIIGNTLICWGEAPAVQGDQTVNLPKTYKRADYSVSFSVDRRADGTAQPVVGMNEPRLVSSFSFRVNGTTTNQPLTEGARWMTIGEWDGVS